ncbi:AAA family ATPase [Streptomyces sp. NPDC088752]|uniref:AAA family ATPase n=1 Tax=Streptomyces sp. NPDC088752 TaxID=3154963 RepID=UPI003416F4CD
MASRSRSEHLTRNLPTCGTSPHNDRASVDDVLQPVTSHDQIVRSVQRRLTKLVGRKDQLALAKALLLESTANCLVLQGEAGVGKSRLAEEVLAFAQNLGHPVIQVAARGGATPLTALAPLIPPETIPEDPISLFRACAARLRWVLGETEPPGKKLVLLIDDLQWLDGASRTLLRQLLDAGLLLLVATVRLDPGTVSGHPNLPTNCSQTLWLHLDPFTEEEVTGYLSAMLDGPVTSGVCRDFSRLSAGNLFYLQQLFLGALRSGRLHRRSGVWQLDAPPCSTPILTRLITDRLADVKGSSREIVEILACCEPLDLGALAHAVPLGDCAHLEARGIIQVKPVGRRYLCSLAHPLYAEVVKAQTPEVRRRAIYRSQATWLKEVGGRRADDAVRAASFELAAEGVADIPVLLDAARRARRAEDYQKVITLLDGVPGDHAGFFAWFARGEAHHHLGRFDEAEESLRNAQNHAPDLRRFLDVLLLRTHNAVYGSGSLEAAKAIGQEALLADEGQEHPDRAAIQRVLRVGEAAAELFRRPMSEVVRLLKEADMVETPELRRWAVLQRAQALCFTGRTDEARQDLSLAWTRPRSVNKARGETSSTDMHLGAWAMVVHIETGRFEEAREVGGEGYQRAVRSGSRQFQTVYACQMGRCELVTGNLHAARDWFGEAAAALHGVDQPMLAEQTWSGLMAVHAQLGDVDEAEAAAINYRTAQAAGHEGGVWKLQGVIAHAWLLVVRDEMAQAHNLLDEGAAYLRRQERFAHESMLLLERARLGAAKEVSQRLNEIAALCTGGPTHLRAEVAAAMASGRGDHLLRVARACEEVGMVLLGAETALRASRIYADQGKRRAAAEARQVSDLLRRVSGNARTPGLAHRQDADTLTPREKEIALMAAEGMSSREIATGLVLSIRTVENFLQRVYNKTGITSRRELPRVLADLLE